MIDGIMGVYASRKYSDLDAGYNPEKAIEHTEIVNPNSQKLTVLFPPWRGGDSAYDLLTRRYVKSGSAVLRYKFSHQILEPNLLRVQESFEFIRDKVVENITNLTEHYKYEKVEFVASSLGNVSMALVAKGFSDFDSATFVVAGSNLARSVWEGSRTQSVRKAFEVQGIDVESLDDMWASLAPKNAANAFAGKSVELLISNTDKVIPTFYQLEMGQALSEAGAETLIQNNRTGHIATVARYCANGNI